MDALASYREMTHERTGDPVTVVGRTVARAWPWVSATPLSTTTEPGSSSMREPCLRCGKIPKGPSLLAHAKAEEYLIELIKRDHPEWGEPDGTCPRCAAYYRTLVEQVGV